MTVDDQEVTVVRERRGGRWLFALDDVNYSICIEAPTRLFGVNYVLKSGTGVVSEVVETERWKWFRSEFIVRCLNKSYYLRLRGGLRKDHPIAALVDGQRDVGYFKRRGSILSDVLDAEIVDDIPASTQILCLIALRHERSNPGAFYIRGRPLIQIGG